MQLKYQHLHQRRHRQQVDSVHDLPTNSPSSKPYDPHIIPFRPQPSLSPIPSLTLSTPSTFPTGTILPRQINGCGTPFSPAAAAGVGALLIIMGIFLGIAILLLVWESRRTRARHIHNWRDPRTLEEESWIHLPRLDEEQHGAE
jgi:hypothetical protein